MLGDKWESLSTFCIDDITQIFRLAIHSLFVIHTYAEDVGLTMSTVDISGKVKVFSIRRDSRVRHAITCYIERHAYCFCPFSILSNRAIDFQKDFFLCLFSFFFFGKRHFVVTSEVNSIQSTCEYRTGFVKEGIELRSKLLFIGKVSITEFRSVEVIVSLSSPVRSTTRGLRFAACSIHDFIFSVESGTIF